MNILLVEDTEIIRIFVTKFIKELGHQVIEAKDGLEGVNQILNQDIDFVFSDINMPHLDGIGLTKISKILKPLLPVVLISASYSDEQLKAAFAAGANLVTGKPTSSDVVNDLIINTNKNTKNNFKLENTSNLAGKLL